jgi:hypothetical protein
MAQASKAVVEEAQKLRLQMIPARDFPLPETGQVRFVLLAYKGIFASQAAVNSLTSGESPLASLYQSVKDLLSQMRLLEEKKRKSA